MTTADIMLAQPGNPESFRDHEYDARTISWALLAAILIHLVVAFLLAAFSGVFSPSVPFEEKPAELTFVDLSPTSAAKNSAFIETDESKKAPEPKDKTFESNANSIGASELAAVGELPLPSQDGKDRPLMDFETNPHSLETKGAQPQQSTAAPQPKQMTAPQPAPITAAEQFALLTQKPTAASEPSTAASQARSAYRRQKERTHISGNITSRGISADSRRGREYFASRRSGSGRTRFHHFSKPMIVAWIIAETPGIANTVFGFFTRGGLFMWPLLACSIVSVTTMILRGLALRRKNV